jgi:uncharacterized protein YccT (UPF0319 family)
MCKNNARNIVFKLEIKNISTSDDLRLYESDKCNIDSINVDA